MYCYIVVHRGWVICMIGKLLELARRKCHESNCSSCYIIKHKFSGCTLIISGACQQGHHFYWASSCTIGKSCGNAVHEDNILFATAIVLYGNNFQKIEDFATSCCLTDYFSHVSAALHLSWDKKIFFKTQIKRASFHVYMVYCECLCTWKDFVPILHLPLH